MKKIVYIFCLFILAFACQTDDDNEEVIDPTTVDADGDGINYTNELLSGSDPNDPCDYADNKLYYPATSLAWRNLDCDGDGVTNGMELDPDGNETIEDNKTNPKWQCELIVANQTVTPSVNWLNTSCDNDPLSNGQEISDGTDIFDSCDFILENQDMIANQSWLDSDCDDDCRSNGREIEDGTDLFDPTDFDGAGSILREIRSGNLQHLFSDNGTYYDKVIGSNGELAIDFEYNSQNQLAWVWINDDPDIFISFTYTNNKISKVTRTEGSDQSSYDLVHTGNLVYAYDNNQTEPNLIRKYVFNDQELLLSRGTINTNDSSKFWVETYNYDSSFQNLVSIEAENKGYNYDNDEYFNLPESNTEVGSFSYDHPEVTNPFYEVYQNIRMNIILGPGGLKNSEIISRTLLKNVNSLSTDLNTSANYIFSSPTGSSSLSTGLSPSYIQENGLPSKVNWSYISGSWWDNFDYEIYYY